MYLHFDEWITPSFHITLEISSGPVDEMLLCERALVLGLAMQGLRVIIPWGTRILEEFLVHASFSISYREYLWRGSRA